MSKKYRPLEKSIEDRFVAFVTKKGYKALKMNGEGHKDWPDRLVVGKGVMVFFEFKRDEKEELSSGQEDLQEWLIDNDIPVFTCFTLEAAKHLFYCLTER